MPPWIRPVYDRPAGGQGTWRLQPAVPRNEPDLRLPTQAPWRDLRADEKLAFEASDRVAVAAAAGAAALLTELMTCKEYKQQQYCFMN